MQQTKTKDMQKPAVKPMLPAISTQDREKIIAVKMERQRSFSEMKLLPPCRR